MALLPSHPNLDHLRRQARDRLRAVRAGDADAPVDMSSIQLEPKGSSRSRGCLSTREPSSTHGRPDCDAAEEAYRASVRECEREHVGGNEPLMRVLLERGAVVEDDDLYLVAFGNDDQRCLRLLLEYTGDVAETACKALAAPISTNETEAVRLLVDAGADPRRYHDDEDRPASAAYEAVTASCSAELVELLLAHGADQIGHGGGGRTPYQRATSQGRRDLTELLHRYGASEDASDADHRDV
jgi:hypothetical protein